MCRRLHKKFCGLDKDTHQITKPCKYDPLKTRNNDGIILGKFLPSEASAMLGCPKLEFRAPVGALWCWYKVNSPHRGPVTQVVINAIMWANCYANNRRAHWLIRLHHIDVIMRVMASQITSLMIVYSTVCSGRENIKAPRHWPLWGEFTGGRWIPRTKNQ